MQIRATTCRTALFAFSLTFLAAAASADDKYVAKADGKFQISCKCVVAVAGCQSKLFDSLAGSERLEWTQDGYFKTGQTYNLDAACYRKRSVNNKGDGLCCEVLGDEQRTIKNMFRGTVN